MLSFYVMNVINLSAKGHLFLTGIGFIATSNKQGILINKPG